MNKRHGAGILVAGLVLGLASPSFAARTVIELAGTCTVTEVLYAEGQAYLHCREEDGVWVTMAERALGQRLGAGSEVRYGKDARTGGLYVKGLDRTFPIVWHAYNYISIIAARTDSDRPLQNASGREDGVYAGTDDSGALVFSDSPANVPKKRQVKKKQKQ